LRLQRNRFRSRYKSELLQDCHGDSADSASGEPSYLRLRLLQIKPHVHFVVQRGGDGEMLLCLLALARAPVESAEAEMAVGDERAHPELASKGQGVAIMLAGGLGLERVPLQRRVSEEAERPGFITALVPLPCERAGPLAVTACLVGPAGEE